MNDSSGFDDSLHWTTGRGGARTGGTLKTVDGDNNVVQYELVLREPPFNRSSIQGRGTVSWHVIDCKSKRRLLVKDYWMSEGRIPELELLNEVKGLQGVSQMVSFEEMRGQTKDFRGDTEAFDPKKFRNRIAVRIVLETYGRSIDELTSAEEFLGATRDAIAGEYILMFISAF